MRKPKSKLSYIYRLRDPRTNKIVYVGTTVNPKRRLTQIMNSAMVGRSVICWADELKADGLVAIMEIIEECATEERLERERYWIEHYNKRCDLLNYDGVKRPYNAKRFIG